MEGGGAESIVKNSALCSHSARIYPPEIKSRDKWGGGGGGGVIRVWQALINPGESAALRGAGGGGHFLSSLQKLLSPGEYRNLLFFRR